MKKDIGLNKSPFDEGREAFHDGMPRDMNPYARGTVKFVAWLRGYNEEKARQLRSNIT